MIKRLKGVRNLFPGKRRKRFLTPFWPGTPFWLGVDIFLVSLGAVSYNFVVARAFAKSYLKTVLILLAMAIVFGIVVGWQKQQAIEGAIDDAFQALAKDVGDEAAIDLLGTALEDNRPFFNLSLSEAADAGTCNALKQTMREAASRRGRASFVAAAREWARQQCYKVRLGAGGARRSTPIPTPTASIRQQGGARRSTPPPTATPAVSQPGNSGGGGGIAAEPACGMVWDPPRLIDNKGSRQIGQYSDVNVRLSGFGARVLVRLQNNGPTTVIGSSIRTDTNGNYSYYDHTLISGSQYQSGFYNTYVIDQGGKPLTSCDIGFRIE